MLLACQEPSLPALGRRFPDRRACRVRAGACCRRGMASQPAAVNPSTYRVGARTFSRSLCGARTRSSGGAGAAGRRRLLPLIGEVQAAGKTVNELREEITKRLEKFVPDAAVSVTVLKTGSQRIYVLGKVTKPGEFPVAGTSTCCRRSAWPVASPHSRTRMAFASCGARATAKAHCIRVRPCRPGREARAERSASAGRRCRGALTLVHDSDPRIHVAGAIVAAAGALAASPAIAQQWSVYAGAAGRVEYNDNYFFTAPGSPCPATPR